MFAMEAIHFIFNALGGCCSSGNVATASNTNANTPCYNAVAEQGKRFRGKEQLNYAVKIGLGSTEYELIEL